MTTRELRRRMTERELSDWMRYSAQKGLPSHRMEMMLAKLCMFIDIGILKRPKARVMDYMLEPPASDESGVDLEDVFGDGITVIGPSNG